MSFSRREEVLCPFCGAPARVLRRLKPGNALVLEYYCPQHGFLKAEELRVELPSRRLAEGGLYVAFEGIDASGKTTQAGILYDYLRAHGYEVVLVREPWVKAIKEFLYKHDVDPDAETYLFAADRIILQKEVVLPSLEQGKLVISDRSVFASLAYQVARGVDEEFVLAVNRSIRFPDLVFLLDLPVEEAVRRLSSRGQLSRFEERGFMEKVRARYLELAEAYKSRFAVVDASQPVEEVHRRVAEHLRARYGIPAK
uniref:Probable thymidylate kinase n=1 Tax=Thermofilum pendens TaxID=2269 RepID=A0A7C4BAM1_THEPE